MAPIHVAAIRGDVEALRRLLAEGVSPDAGDYTPLHCLSSTWNGATAGDYAACFKLLRDAGANLEAVDSGKKPLHLAAINSFPELLSLLVQARVNLDATCAGGTYGSMTALHISARMSGGRATDCVEVLLAAGASVNARDISGRTPFDVALLDDRRRVWPLFLRAGAEIPTNNTDPYLVRVRNAGGFKKYEQQHLARITAILAPTPRLPPEMVRKIVEFWLHAGFY